MVPDGVVGTITESPDGVITPTLDWLSSVLLPKVLQWAEESRRGFGSRGRRHETLVPLDRYSSLYGEMREKYGPSLIEVCTCM